MSLYDLLQSLVDALTCDAEPEHDVYASGDSFFAVCGDCEWESELTPHEDSAAEALADHKEDDHGGYSDD